MQQKNKHFKNIIDMDYEGCLRIVSWADARSSMAPYKYFEDMMTFNTTYLTNGFKMSFALFEG